MVAIGSRHSILKSDECWMSARSTPLPTTERQVSARSTPLPTTRWWCHSFGDLYNRNHWADDEFSTFSAVRCVRFSVDGKYLATVCENTARIYDTRTGARIWFGPFLVDGAPGSDTVIVAVTWSMEI